MSSDRKKLFPEHWSTYFQWIYFLVNLLFKSIIIKMQFTNILYKHQNIHKGEMLQKLKMWKSLRFVVCAILKT